MNLINLKETNNHYVLSIPQNLEKRAKKNCALRMGFNKQSMEVPKK